MRVCLMVEGQEGVDWPQWLALARATEDAGLEGLFRSDHYRSIGRGDPAGSLDAWLTLAALATQTERIRLGTMVSPVTFRHPSVLAKSVVTADHVQAAIRHADEYNTVFPSVDEARERRLRLDDAAREAGREPLTFSMMTGCVVGRDEADVHERIDAWRAVTRRDGEPPIAGTVDKVVERLRAFEEVGVERVMLQHLVHEDVEMVAVVGEVAARLR